MEVERGKVRAPEIGQVWLNSPPLTLRGLRGRVVLIDFWDYTCINCIRTLPYLVAWHRRYAGKGLTIIGVHAPEFSFARTIEFVQGAIERFSIPYPVAVDNGYMIWQAFANKCWPAKYLIDKDGYIRFFHFGEGDYQETELAIQSLLREADPALECGALMAPLRDTDRPGAACYRTTPELYLGYQRGRIGNPGGFLNLPSENPVPADTFGGSASYHLPGKLDADVFYLSGLWQCGPESVRSAPCSADEPASVLVYYTAKKVNLVMNPGDFVRSVEVLQDGQPLRREDAGEDVCYGASGESVVQVDMPRMYNLARNAKLRQHLLQVVSREAGLECFAFTFVTCAAAADG